MRAKTVLVSLLLAAMCVSTEAANFVITEFMSANTKTYRDEDNAYSDWIEIYNTTSSTQNLGGWYLTDNPAVLNKWQFPATNVGPNGFVIVFASSKNRRVAGAPLHANFALGAGGEYLALLQPNMVKASEFPDSIEQFPDVPFGFLMPGVTTTNIRTGADVRVLVPTGDIGTQWREKIFDDGTWLSGVTGVGYDTGTNYNSAIGMNVGAAMLNVNASAYLRVPFTVTDPSLFKILTLRMRYDDGFVAYLNGTEVLRRNAPVTPAWNSAATNYHGGGIGYTLTEDFEGAGNNYTSSQMNAAPGPTVQAAGAGSTGKFMRLLNDGVNDNHNALTFRQTAPGLFQTIIAEFDFRVADASANPADGFAFMLIPTATYGTNGAGHTTQSSPFEEPSYPGIFAIGFDVYPHGTQNDVSLHWNGSEKINVTIPPATLELVANQFHRVKLVLEHVAGGARASVTFIGNINGTPGAAYTPITNYFIPDLNPFDCRLEFAGRTGGANMSVDLDNLNVQFMPPAGSLGFEEFNISSALPLITSGANVLAIQALNLSANDTNFLISPELIAAGFEMGSTSNYISPATPGTWNNVLAAGTLPPVVISPASGVHTNSVTVTISSSSSSAQIRYTLNGTEPTETSPLYTAPLTYTANTAIRARAFEAGKISGAINGANYIVLDNSMTNFTSNLPLVVIDTMGAAIPADSKVIGYGLFFDTNANGTRVSMMQQADHAGRVAVEIAGQSSTQFPKKSYNLELRGEQEDDDLKTELLGLPRGSDWRLYAPYTDKTLMNDFLTYELHEAMGHYSVRRKFVEVFARTTAGKLAFSDYVGVYVLLEKIRIDPERVNIEKPQSGSPGDPITGGYIFKRDKGTPGDIEFKTIYQTATIAGNGVALQFHDPDGAKLSQVQRSWLTNHLMTAELALYGANWRHPTLGYRAFYDLDSYVDFHWIVEFPKNIDGVRLSNYLIKDRGGLIREEPIWDWNLSWGNANYLEGGNTNGWYWPMMSEMDDMYLRRMRTDPDFTQTIIDRWGHLRTNIFALSNLIARIEAKTNLLNEAKDREFTRWPRLNTYVWPNPDGPNLTSADNVTLTWNVNYAINNTYQQLIGEMKKWVVGRSAWVESQYPASPTLSLPSGFITPGAVLTIAGPAGTIYYTLDGTDPRGSNGVVKAGAKIYSGAITLTNNSGVFARVLNGQSWTAPARGVYVVSTPSLRISEIMYHPADPASGSPYEEEDFEFVEIQNTGTNSINLSGAELAGAVQFTFGSTTLAPGQFAVVVRNLAGFQSRYGAGISVAGVFSGKFSNSSDHIVLTGPVGEPILDFNYNDGWYEITDGLGFSLVARDTSAVGDVWGNSAAWRAASLLGGSPGSADPLLAIAPIVVNEILANSVTPAFDWIELHNPLATNVNIGGWYLTDDFAAPKKFRISDGTEIPAHGYFTFNEASFNPDPLNTNSFSLGSDGDDVYLFSADLAGNLTGYVDGFDFGASDEGVTFGRFVASDSSVDYPALAAATYNNPNASPIIGPIVISEIMYRPPDLLGFDNEVDEFIELKNISGGSVPLFNSALPDKTWRLRDAVDFDFPTNVILAPGENIVVVSFSPTNAAALAAFRSKFNVSPSVAIFGPFSGKLDNSGERIELHRPGQLRTNGVPYVMAEKVAYSDDTPWNGAADGFGPSLHRLMPAGYANDPANWTAASPTPGAPQLPGEAPVIIQQPSNITMVAGGDTNLSVTAQGSNLQFQWRFEGADIPGATSGILPLPNVDVADQGVYRVAVFNDSGAVLSESATVTIRALPVFTSQPFSQTNNPGSNTVLSAFATGTGSVTYQWRKDGVEIEDATNTTLALPNVQLYADSALYDVLATDEIGTVTSEPAYLVVKVAPYMITRGATNVVLQGGTSIFTVNVGPDHPLLPMTYRWVPSPISMGSYTNVTTTYYTNKEFVLTNCLVSGFVRVVARNPVGDLNMTTVAAGAPTNYVLADFDRDGMADNWERIYNFATNNNADATLDLDGDGMNNRDEYVAGTNPTNDLSVLKLFLKETVPGTLQFTAESNISYSIQIRTNLNTSWQTWSNVDPWNAVRAIEFSQPMTNSERFFRVVTPSVP